jgi:hypothetical protein
VNTHCSVAAVMEAILRILSEDRRRQREGARTGHSFTRDASDCQPAAARVRDFAQVNQLPIVTREVALGASELLEIDACGFDKMDRAILAAIIDKFDGGPVGVETLAAAVEEESDTIGDVYEPYLLQEGFIARTARACCHAACVHTFGPCPPRHVAVGHSSHDSQTLFLRNVTELHVRRFADRKRDSSANCGGVWAVLST